MNLKTYLSTAALLVFAFVWFLFLGPRMLSGSTEMILIWFLTTIFGILPGLYIVGRNIFKKVANNV